MQLDAMHLLGYAGALVSLFVGAAQLVKILRKKKADDVSALDYLVRAVAALMLGVYSTSKMDVVFLVVNFESGVLSLAVLGTAWWARSRARDDRPNVPQRRPAHGGDTGRGRCSRAVALDGPTTTTTKTINRCTQRFLARPVS